MFPEFYIFDRIHPLKKFVTKNSTFDSFKVLQKKKRRGGPDLYPLNPWKLEFYRYFEKNLTWPNFEELYINEFLKFLHETEIWLTRHIKLKDCEFWMHLEQKKIQLKKLAKIAILADSGRSIYFGHKPFQKSFRNVIKYSQKIFGENPTKKNPKVVYLRFFPMWKSIRKMLSNEPYWHTIMYGQKSEETANIV